MRARHLLYLLLMVMIPISLAAIRSPAAPDGFGQEAISLTADETVVPVGTEIELTALFGDAGIGVPIQFQINGLNWDSPVNSDSNGKAEKSYTASTPGIFAFKAVNNGYSGSNVVNITVVAVDRVVQTYPAPASDREEGDAIVFKGDSLTLHADRNPAPADGAYPSAQPVWSVIEQPASDLNTIAAGYDSWTIDTTNLAVGKYIVRAKCGNVDTGDTFTFYVTQIMLHSVSFTGFTGSSGIELTRPEDDSLVSAPEWRDDNFDGSTTGANDTQEIAAIPMQVVYQVKVGFGYLQGVDPTEIFVWAEGDYGGLNSSEAAVQLDSSGEAILTVNAPPQTIDYQEKAAWTFKCRIGELQTVHDIGYSTHEICAPHGIADLSPVYDLIMVASCKSCVGLGTDVKEVADRVYTGLEANALKRDRVTKLKYSLVGVGEGGANALNELFTDGKHSCGPWAFYFWQQVQSHGGVQNLDQLKIVGFKLKNEQAAVQHAGDKVWTGMVTTKPGMNNTAPGMNFGGKSLVALGTYAQGHNNSTSRSNISAVNNPWKVWGALDHAVNILKHGDNVIVYDTSFSGGPFTLQNVAMPQQGTTSELTKQDPFVSTYFLPQFSYLEGTLQTTAQGGGGAQQDELYVPSANFDNTGAAPNKLIVIWELVAP